MPIPLHFSNWPVWMRCIAAASAMCVFAATLSLMGGCGGVQLRIGFIPRHPGAEIIDQQFGNAASTDTQSQNGRGRRQPDRGGKLFGFPPAPGSDIAPAP